jgi:hypothetical protein
MDRSSVDLLVDGIKSMTNFFTSVSFIHMKRNLNEAAHILSLVVLLPLAVFFILFRIASEELCVLILIDQ